MITLRNITLRRGPHILLQDVSWTIYHRQRIGIIGSNGSGKTSLFNMLLGKLENEKGNLEIPRQIKLAHVAQETPAVEQSALDFVLDGDDELRALQHDLVQAELINNGEKIALLHARMSEVDAYTASARAAQMLNGLGFNHIEQQKKVKEFSGGWRVRLNLAKALMARSDVLLLDEPTNHLDLDAVIWLENWLKKYSGTLLLISHDRDFLDDVADHIAHISQQQLMLYSGNYSSFEKQRAEKLLLQQAVYEKQQKHVQHLQSFINRFRAKATKAKQAQSRVKALARLELVSAVQEDSSFTFQFKPSIKCPNPLLRLEQASIVYGEKTILSDINLTITPKDRIALLGPNGAGKTSLIKLLAGELSPYKGLREVSEGLKIGYFAQHQVDHLNLDETPLYHLQRLAPQHKDQELRTFLGSFGFTGSRVTETIKQFSGGEKSRLALALIVWQQPNLLLLDEPTNHLDLDMRNALSMALQDYQGAMILVSHDRFLVRTTVDQLALVADGKLQDFEGDLKEYELWLSEFRRNEADIPTSSKNDVSRKEQRQLDAKMRERRRPLVQQIKHLEDQLTQCQIEVTEIEKLLMDCTLYEAHNKESLQKYILRKAALEKEIQVLELKWIEACEQLDYDSESPLS